MVDSIKNFPYLLEIWSKAHFRLFEVKNYFLLENFWNNVLKWHRLDIGKNKKNWLETNLQKSALGWQSQLCDYEKSN